MSDLELLRDYRKRVIRLQLLQEQLANCNISGAPAGLHAHALTGMPRGTNEPTAAAVQLYEGLCMLVDRQQEALRALWPKVEKILCAVEDARLFMIIFRYYGLGQTVDEIALSLYISERTVARMKKGFAEFLRKKDAEGRPSK